ncbi:MAG: LacI family DNA-binding transcriptional regulator [Chloroflexota bacterium]|jgi:LacI family transcriptional regulator
MANIKQVAKSAHVSVATVSRVINESGYVSPELRERVLNAMRDLNYQPNAPARSLRRQETRTVGVLVPQLDHPFFSALSFAIEKTLSTNDYHTFICSAEESQAQENRYIHMMLRQRVDGVILVPTAHSQESVELALEQDIPIVIADRDLPDLRVNRVLADNFQGGYLGIQHLLEYGHRRIGLVGSPIHSEPIGKRIRGALQAFSDYGVDYNPDLVITGDQQQFEMGYAGARHMLQQSPRPTAIFALTDVMAIGAMHAAFELGMALPEDLSVVGFDDIPLASYVIPALTTIAQPIYTLGETAAQILLRHMRNGDHPIETVKLKTKLVTRKSTAPPAN